MTMQLDSLTLIQEQVGEEIYEYYPLGRYVVIAPGVCGGRPTFKYTRLEVAIVLALLATGMSSQDIINEYEESDLSYEAIQEAIHLANAAFLKSVRTLLPLAV